MVNTEGWPADTNWTGQSKDDAIAIQGYTKNCALRGSHVHMSRVQTPGGAACVKVSGSSDVHVDAVTCEGHANSVTLDASQYTATTHARVLISNLIALDPIENALNMWGAGAVGKDAPALFKQITVVSPVIAQRNLSLVTLPGSPGLSRRGVAGAYLCYVDDVRPPSFLLLLCLQSCSPRAASACRLSSLTPQ